MNTISLKIHSKVSVLRATSAQDVMVLPLLVLALIGAVFTSFCQMMIMTLSHQPTFLTFLNYTAFSSSFHSQELHKCYVIYRSDA